MGATAVDRKRRRGVRQERGRWQATCNESELPSRPRIAECNIDAMWEADVPQIGICATEPLPHDRFSQLPSPLRRRDGETNLRTATTEVGAPLVAVDMFAAGSYRDRLRANGQRALQQWQQSGLMQRPGQASTAPPTLDNLIGGSSTPPRSPQVPAGQEQYQYDQWQAPSPQALHMAQMPPMFGMPITPSNMPTASTASTPTGGLMAIAMPQAAGCDMSGEQIAAELRAVQPECYED